MSIGWRSYMLILFYVVISLTLVKIKTQPPAPATSTSDLLFWLASAFPRKMTLVGSIM